MNRNLLQKAGMIAILLGLQPACYGQTNAQNAPHFKLQGPAEQSNSLVIRDALNRPCLDIEAASRAHTVNRELFDHVVSIKNRCTKLIKVKICYFNSENCKSVDMGSYQREDLILGTMTKVNSFRYSIYQR